MTTEDILQPIPDEQLPELKKLFLKDWPTTSYVYNLIDTCMEWRKSATMENCVSFYCPHGDFSDGTFVAIIELTLVDIFIYTLDNTHRRLEMALRATNRIAWNNKPLFIGMNTAYLDMVLNIGKEKHYPSIKYPLGNMFWLAKEKALQYEYCIPTEIYIAPLQDDHVVQINSTWPTKAPGTYEYLSKLLALNGGTGFFLKNSNELCAWVIRNCYGGLGMLQVDEKHRRRGYGTLMIKLFSKMVAQSGIDVTANIYGTNEASKALFKSLGFEPKLEITWCQF